MQFNGGKARVAKGLVSMMLTDLGEHPRRLLVEPFMGACAVTAHAAPHFDHVWASDMHLDLSLLFTAMQQGWCPPQAVTREQYDAVRNLPASALRGFVGYACSFGGKWFGGYAKNRPAQDYARCGASSLAKKFTLARGFANVTFRHAAYQDLDIPPGAICYCDPPYAGTTPPGEGWPFSSADFWEWAVRQRAAGVRMYVSEERAPEGWREVGAVVPWQVGMRRTTRPALVERLFA